jgi:beta-lactamase regulating signal transducer with metallopeptidase domain
MPEIFTISNGLVTLIVGGMGVQMVWLGLAAWSWQEIRRQAVPERLPDELLARMRAFAGTKEIPPIFVSNQIAVPLLAGWLRPAILLPDEAHHWQAERLAMVLYHELAHFRRGDSMFLPLLCALRIFYWWNPLVWLARARLLRERESACDDLVLNQNFRATDYADLIVATARRANTFLGQDGVFAMTSRSKVGERIRVILDPAINRRPASRASVLAGIIVAFVLGWFFVAVQVQAEDKPLTTDTTATTNTAKPQIEIGFKLVEIDEKTYRQQTAAIDEAVKNGNISFFINLHGASLVSSPSVTTQVGLKAEISMGKELIQDDKTSPVTTLAATSVLNANGNATSVVTPSQTMGPSETFLGAHFEAKPSLSKDGTILLLFVFRVGEITHYKDNANWAVDTTTTRDKLKAQDGKSYGYWVGQQHSYSLVDMLKSPGDQIKTLPPLSPFPNRLALIVTAHQ